MSIFKVNIFGIGHAYALTVHFGPTQSQNRYPGGHSIYTFGRGLLGLHNYECMIILVCISLFKK